MEPKHIDSRITQAVLLDHLKYCDQSSDIVHNIEQNNRLMVIMRGPSGSGKTTLSQMICDYAQCPYVGHIFSTDDKFVDNKGFYRFDAQRLSEYHAINHKDVSTACEVGISPIIVDNTNTSRWEMKPYVIAAANFNYVIVLLTPLNPWARNIKKLYRNSLHGVPKPTIQKMLQNFENASVADLMREFKCKYTKALPQKATQFRTGGACGDNFKSKTVTSDVGNGSGGTNAVVMTNVADDLVVQSSENLNDATTTIKMEGILPLHAIGCANENLGFRFLRELFPEILVAVLWKHLEAHNGDCNQTVDTIYNWNGSNQEFSEDECEKVQFICDCVVTDENFLDNNAYSENNVHVAMSVATPSEGSVGQVNTSDFEEIKLVKLKMGDVIINSLFQMFAPGERPQCKKADLYVPESLAQELFCCLKNEFYIQTNNETDAMLARVLQDNENELIYANSNDIAGPSGVKSIKKTDVNDNVWSRKAPYDVTTDIKIYSLLENFPSMEKPLIRDILVASNNDVDIAKKFLAEMAPADQMEIETEVQPSAAIRNPIVEEFPSNENVFLYDVPRTNQVITSSKIFKSIASYERFRAEAQYHSQLRHESYQKYASTHHTPSLKYFQSVASYHKRNTCISNNMAVNLLLDQFMSGNSSTIDLHYMHLNEAKMTLDLFLNTHIRRLNGSNRTVSVNVITGWGRHSAGKSKIKDFVRLHCLTRNFRCDQVNVGMFRVTITKTSQISCVFNNI